METRRPPNPLHGWRAVVTFGSLARNLLHGSPQIRRARADKVLAQAFAAHSRAALQRAFEAGLVRRNGVTIAKSDEVRSGDQVEFSLPEVAPAELKAVAIPSM